MLRPRKRAAGLIAGALLLFVVGTSVQAGWLLVLASCLLGAAVSGLLFPGRMVRGIEVERRAPSEAFQGEEIRVDLVVANRSRAVRLALDLRDDHLEPVRAFVGRLSPGERVVVETTRIAMRRGVHEVSDVVVASAAPFGVAERRRRLEVPSATIVYPRLVALEGLSFLESAPTPERALHADPRRGGGPDYLGIREYRTGDSMRHINWPSTARHGELMVREFEREQTRRLAVVLDAIDDGPVEGAPTPLDVACSIAASVAFAAHGAGQGVRLVSSAVGEAVSLSRADPAAMLRWLAELRPGGGLSLAALAAELGDEVLGAETVLLVAPTWRSNAAAELADAVADVVGRAPRVVVALVQVGAFEGIGPVPHLAEAEVDDLIRALEARGALVLPTGRGDDLVRALAGRAGARA